MLVSVGADELLSLVVQLKQFRFFSVDCLEGLPPSLGRVQLQMLVRLQERSQCILCPGACWSQPCRAQVRERSLEHAGSAFIFPAWLAKTRLLTPNLLLKACSLQIFLCFLRE